MNFMHTFYPSLLKVPGFLVEFITPIIKVSPRHTHCTQAVWPQRDTWQQAYIASFQAAAADVDPVVMI